MRTAMFFTFTKKRQHTVGALNLIHCVEVDIANLLWAFAKLKVDAGETLRPLLQQAEEQVDSYLTEAKVKPVHSWFKVVSYDRPWKDVEYSVW